MNNEKWINKCVDFIAFSSAMVALFGVIGYSGEIMPGGWIDTRIFYDISNRATSTFSNPNILATYLIMTAPFLWMKLRDEDISRSGKMFSFIGCLLSFACVVLTWSRGGWLGYIAALIVYMLMNCRYALKYLFIGGITIPVVYSFIPDNIVRRFSSIGSLADSSIHYRLFTWKGSLKMLADHFIGGIGVGTSAFHQVYPIYSYVGTEATLHSHNLFLEIAIEIGIVGLALFLMALLGTVRSALNKLKTVRTGDSRFILSAAIAGLVAALVHGMVDYIWYNYRVFFVFWVIVAIIRAYSRLDCSDCDSYESEEGANECNATLSIVFDQG